MQIKKCHWVKFSTPGVFVSVRPSVLFLKIKTEHICIKLLPEVSRAQEWSFGFGNVLDLGSGLRSESDPDCTDLQCEFHRYRRQRPLYRRC